MPDLTAKSLMQDPPTSSRPREGTPKETKFGGSVAKAARAEGLAREIVAIGRRRESLEPAWKDGAVDHITTNVAEGVYSFSLNASG